MKLVYNGLPKHIHCESKK